MVFPRFDDIGGKVLESFERSVKGSRHTIYRPEPMKMRAESEGIADIRRGRGQRECPSRKE
jgi:hypothetical protein